MVERLSTKYKVLGSTFSLAKCKAKAGSDPNEHLLKLEVPCLKLTYQNKPYFPALTRMARHCGEAWWRAEAFLSLLATEEAPIYHQFPTVGAPGRLGENPNIQSALELCSVTILPRTFKCPSQGKMATMPPFPCGARVV